MTDLAPRASGGSAAASGRTRAADAEPLTATSAGRRPWTSRIWVLPVAEAVVSVVAALGYTLLCTRIGVNPMNRLGQVSGLARMQLFAAVLGLPLLGVLLYTAYRGRPSRHQLVKRLVCAALAGLATGVVAGGVVVALRGTPWPLGGQEGDPSVLVEMANSFRAGEGMSGIYPPGFPALMAVWSKVRYGDTIGGTGFALKDMQIFFSALVGPMAYLAWRLLLRPFWALLIAVPAAVLFLDPIRPYSHVVMIVLLPLLGYCLLELRRAGTRSMKSLMLRGAGMGLIFAVLFLWYSGWYVWAAPGVGLLALFLFPWRAGAPVVKRAAVYVGSVLLTAGFFGAPLLYQMLRLGAQTPDRYAYLAVYVDPAYIMGFASDRAAGKTYMDWPASGEMAGQSGFALLLLFGVGLGVGLGLRNVMVRTAAATLAGAWLARFFFASQMAQEKAVQLYPRTTWIILYCLMILCVMGMMAVVQRGSGWAERTLRPAGGDPAKRVVPPRVVRQLSAGLLCALALFATMGASWSVNRYMPAPQSTDSMGLDAWRAHAVKKPDGTCPRFSPVKECSDIKVKRWKQYEDDHMLWCANVVAKDWPAICGRRAPFKDKSVE
ncbi:MULTISPECIES: hypothetical protein [unclassified Streptomyces]|uniref:hypothetical protein n=1 Tax=unclassified Streptomyces TaxID=2593676 RepID=UPI000DC7531C|nr:MULTISPECIES: hypothetical protein [unclassified Streptomyces]AWZ04732.1 hypothetical protein DRB89_08835 [Streptomyces sp. ICC4]AWZ12239.1 hypothetical protein DRB96_07825 [Streptomyces sp. ICC1]